uniref:Uncharacterized protein n=1 Tax=Acrobeloides nanus TaxID=290746 RepID=A0A914DUB2_9BILA
MRDNMGIAVVCMVNTTSSSTSAHTHIGLDNHDRGNIENYTETSVSKGSFEWTSTMQSWLFSAVFYGSFITVLFSGYLADKYGPSYNGSQIMPSTHIEWMAVDLLHVGNFWRSLFNYLVLISF